MFSEQPHKLDVGKSVVSCNYVKLQQFQRTFSKLAGKGEYRQRVPHPTGWYPGIGIHLCLYRENDGCSDKSAVQKFVFEFLRKCLVQIK